jgi:hypothetical protein
MVASYPEVQPWRTDALGMVMLDERPSEAADEKGVSPPQSLNADT